MGPKDNRSLEVRPDVLVYTSAILEQDLEVIGPITAEVYVRSSLEHTDFFAIPKMGSPIFGMAGVEVKVLDGFGYKDLTRSR
jgi:hypothetical protein